MNILVIGEEAVLCRLLQERFEYDSNNLQKEVCVNGVLVVRGGNLEMMRCIKGEYADFPQTLVWQTQSLCLAATAFLLSTAERFSAQNRNLIIHVPDFIPVTSALASRFRIHGTPQRTDFKRYRLSSYWERRREDYLRTFFERSQVE